MTKFDLSAVYSILKKELFPSGQFEIVFDGSETIKVFPLCFFTTDSLSCFGRLLTNFVGLHITINADGDDILRALIWFEK